MADLRVNLFGKQLAGPVIAASGTFGFGPEYAGIEDLRVLGGISGKGLTLNGQPGNDGERLLEKQEAEELYRAFGRAWDKFPEGWKLYLLSSHTEFERTFGKKADKKRKLYNGMLKCDLFMYGRRL